MRERINKFIESKNLTPAEFADKIGVQRSNVSHVLNGRNNPSYTFIEKIIRAFDDVNAKWLLTGIGNMMIEDTDVLAAASNELKLPLETVKEVGKSVSQPVSEVKKESNSPTSKEVTNVYSDENAQTAKKKIVTRVVIFYSDHTFIDYSPSKD